jgi:hypothetical protein
MVACLFHAIHLKKEESHNFIWSSHSFLVHGQVCQFGLQVILEKLSSDHLDLSILDNFVIFFAKCSLIVSFPLLCCFPSSTSYHFCMVFALFFISCLDFLPFSLSQQPIFFCKCNDGRLFIPCHSSQ